MEAPNILDNIRKFDCAEWKAFANHLVLEISDDEHDTLLNSLVPRDYTPGTFLIRDRESSPLFLNSADGNLGLRQWVTKVIKEDLGHFISFLSIASRKFTIDDMIDSILELLFIEKGDTLPLIDRVWNQEYSDIFRRIELYLLTGDIDYQLNIYQHVNDFADEVVQHLIYKFQKEYGATLLDWCKLSVVAGLVGLNEKSSIDATSSFYRACEIPLFINDSIESNIGFIYRKLQDILRIEHRIDSSEIFVDKLLNSKSPIAICIFPDDYIETIFLLKFYDELLLRNDNIHAILIPKSKRCGNDATFDDVMNMLSWKTFPNLVRLAAEGRFIVRNDGPAIGGLNILKLKSELLLALQSMDILDIRGCRAFEMAQGIKKETYFSFNIIREISESITGIDGESYQMAFFHQFPGEYCFKGFRERHKLNKKAPSGREFMVVPFTVYDYHMRNKDI